MIRAALRHHRSVFGNELNGIHSAFEPFDCGRDETIVDYSDYKRAMGRFAAAEYFELVDEDGRQWDDRLRRGCERVAKSSERERERERERDQGLTRFLSLLRPPGPFHPFGAGLFVCNCRCSCLCLACSPLSLAHSLSRSLALSFALSLPCSVALLGAFAVRARVVGVQKPSGVLSALHTLRRHGAQMCRRPFFHRKAIACPHCDRPHFVLRCGVWRWRWPDKQVE